MLYTGRPGIGGQVGSSKKYSGIHSYFKLEDERFKYFFDCISKNREIEEEKLQADAPPKTKEAEKMFIAKEQALGPRPSDILNFKMPKDL